MDESILKDSRDSSSTELPQALAISELATRPIVPFGSSLFFERVPVS